MRIPLLTIAILLPLAGAVVVALLPKQRSAAPKWAALGVALADLALVVGIWTSFDGRAGGFQLVESARWAPSLGLTYKVGIDGLALPMVLLTAVLVVAAILGSWRTERSPRAFFALVLGLEATMLGVFCALDLILFYVFWEAVLIPMYFLIGRWGSEQRERAALKFFLFTLAGSVLMLAGLIAAGLAAGSFDYAIVARTPLAAGLQLVVFWTLLAGFAVKIPIVGLHTWLPLAHVEAPTAGSVLLAGVLLKMGAYGILRFLIPLAPQPFKGATVWLILLGVLNVVWGAVMALAQDDLKRMVAYSSISHMGFVVIGIALATPAAIQGAIFMMVSHGLTAALLFLLVGLVYERTHTRAIREIGGLSRTVPVLAGVWLFASLASLGLPGLSGFVGEFVVLGQLADRAALWTLVPAAAMVITAAYFLRAYQRIGAGPAPAAQEALSELGVRESLAVAPLAVLTLVLGIAPTVVASLTESFARAAAALLSRAG